jgi:NAD(P)-dependent dehydrogenase (short-subunit alcohol dehydrogenase family)
MAPPFGQVGNPPKRKRPLCLLATSPKVISGQGPDEGCVIQADVSRSEDISRVFAQVEREFGWLEIFVSNARPGLAALYQPPMAITVGQWPMALAARLIGTCGYALRRGRPTRPAHVSGAADPDDQQRSNLIARLGVRRPMAVDIFLTIR